MATDKLLFVIHKHHATALHFDLRLQIGKDMPSWAIPKGPTMDPTQKRLCMRVDDHKLAYREFEGNLKEGSEGAGPVMRWDEGYYIAEIETSPGERQLIKDYAEAQKVMAEGLKKGELKFTLHGKKLQGSFALIKTKNFPPGSKKDNWLMIKHKDDHVIPDYDAKKDDISAFSGKTMDQIRETNKK
jgi:bifunctional non-homologous end joining protein LigD